MVIYNSVTKFTTSNHTFDVFNFQYLFLAKIFIMFEKMTYSLGTNQCSKAQKKFNELTYPAYIQQEKVGTKNSIKLDDVTKVFKLNSFHFYCDAM